MVQATANPAKSFPANVKAAMQLMSSARDVNCLLGSHDIQAPDYPMFAHRQIKAGQHLVRAGDGFENLYVVNGGFFKTVFTDDIGNEQVLNFPLKGDLLGADGVGRGVHVNDVVALTDADLLVIPFADLSDLARRAPGIEQALFRTISQQLIEEQLTVSAIGTLCAETRLARFLVRMGDQMAAQGFSRDVFVLRMGRQDLANHLGMKIETISRTLSAMSRKGLIAVNRREVKIADRESLDVVARSGPGRKAVSLSTEAAPAKKKQAAADSTHKRVSGNKQRTSRCDAAGATPWSGLLEDIGVAEPVAA